MNPRVLAPMKFVESRNFADPDLAARKLAVKSLTLILGDSAMFHLESLDEASAAAALTSPPKAKSKPPAICLRPPSPRSGHQR